MSAGGPVGEGGQRLFVAVALPAEVVDRLARLPRPPLAGLRWTPPEQWHVTLRFLGDVEAAAMPSLRRRLAARLRDQPAAAAVVGPATEWLGAGVLVVPVGGLDRLAAAVFDATAGIGRRPEGRRFHGHVTLARRRRRAPDVGGDELAGQRAAATWRVGEVALVHSRLRPAGPQHRTVATFALAPGPAR